MRQVLTLIGSPVSGALNDDLVEAARRALEDLGARVGTTAWLDPGISCDLPFEHRSAEAGFEGAVRERLGGLPIDLAALPAAGRRKALLVADMDSTIVTAETLNELADCVGLKAEVAAITKQAMRGKLDFAEALRARVAMLKGLPVAALDSTLERVRLTDGARTLVRTMQRHGAHAALVSGGFSFVTERVRVACGFDEAVANHLVIEAGRLTGAVAEPIVGREAKLQTLQCLAAQRGLPLSAACAVGDGANDIPMLVAAGLGVAFRGQPAVRAAARVRVDYGDLTALLFLQGYRRSEFRS